MINVLGSERRFSVSPSSPPAQQTPPPVMPRAKLSFSLQSSKWDVLRVQPQARTLPTNPPTLPHSGSLDPLPPRAAGPGSQTAVRREGRGGQGALWVDTVLGVKREVWKQIVAAQQWGRNTCAALCTASGYKGRFCVLRVLPRLQQPANQSQAVPQPEAPPHSPAGLLLPLTQCGLGSVFLTKEFSADESSRKLSRDPLAKISIFFPLFTQKTGNKFFLRVATRADSLNDHFSVCERLLSSLTLKSCLASRGLLNEGRGLAPVAADNPESHCHTPPAEQRLPAVPCY